MEQSEISAVIAKLEGTSGSRTYSRRGFNSPTFRGVYWKGGRDGGGGLSTYCSVVGGKS